MDLEIREFREELINKINESRFPLELKRLVLAEITTMINKACDDVISQQIKEKQSEQDLSEQKKLG